MIEHNFCFFAHLGLKGEIVTDLKRLPSRIQKTILDKGIAKDTTILTVEVSYQDMLKLYEGDYLTPKHDYMINLISIAAALKSITDALSCYCNKPSTELTLSGLNLLCSSAESDISISEISLLCEDLNLMTQGLSIKFIPEQCSNTQMGIHIDFVAFYNSQAMRTINNQPISVLDAIEKRIKTKRDALQERHNTGIEMIQEAV